MYVHSKTVQCSLHCISWLHLNHLHLLTARFLSINERRPITSWVGGWITSKQSSNRKETLICGRDEEHGVKTPPHNNVAVISFLIWIHWGIRAGLQWMECIAEILITNIFCKRLISNGFMMHFFISDNNNNFLLPEEMKTRRRRSNGQRQINWWTIKIREWSVSDYLWCANSTRHGHSYKMLVGLVTFHCYKRWMKRIDAK